MYKVRHGQNNMSPYISTRACMCVYIYIYTYIYIYIHAYLQTPQVNKLRQGLNDMGKNGAPLGGLDAPTEEEIQAMKAGYVCMCYGFVCMRVSV